MKKFLLVAALAFVGVVSAALHNERVASYAARFWAKVPIVYTLPPGKMYWRPLKKEIGLQEIQTHDHVQRVALWVVAQLRDDNAGRAAMADRARRLPYWFNLYLKEDSIGGWWCQETSWSVSSVLNVYGLPTEQLHQMDEAGGGIHQFFRYRLNGQWAVMDPFFGVVYKDNAGQYLDFPDLKNNPAAMDSLHRYDPHAIKEDHRLKEMWADWK